VTTAAATRVVARLVVLILVATPLHGQIRLSDASDRAAFRAWFVLLADAQFERPAPEITDCAALIRFAVREALRPHTAEWYRRVGLPFTPTFADVRSGPRPAAGGWPLFRVAAGAGERYAEFADARTLVALNTRSLGRRVDAAQPGDLLYFRQVEQSQPDHLMVVVGRSHFDPAHDDWVVYHTGPLDGGPGEVRKVRLADLRQHPSPRWRPLEGNTRFVGVFRLTGF
jgi:hypothetical protein